MISFSPPHMAGEWERWKNQRCFFKPMFSPPRSGEHQSITPKKIFQCFTKLKFCFTLLVSILYPPKLSQKYFIVWLNSFSAIFFFAVCRWRRLCDVWRDISGPFKDRFLASKWNPPSNLKMFWYRPGRSIPISLLLLPLGFLKKACRRSHIWERAFPFLEWAFPIMGHCSHFWERNHFWERWP